MSSQLSPFECPVCFEQFDGGPFLPTTLPCGHSCCLTHITALEHCFACRRRTPQQQECSPNFALRDGSILYRRLLLDLNQLQIGSDPREMPLIIPTIAPTEISHALPAPTRPNRRRRRRTTSTRTEQVNSSHIGGLFSWLMSWGGSRNTNSTLRRGEEFQPLPRPTSPTPLTQPIPPTRSTGTQYSAIPHAPTCAPISSPPRPPTVVNTIRSTSYTTNSILTRVSAAAISIKSCGHECSPSSLDRCCGCMDRRPILEGNYYPVYVDGSGWMNIGSRSEGYCPVCK